MAKPLYSRIPYHCLGGAVKANEPLHGMLEAQLDSALVSNSPQAEVVRNTALLHYLSTLASSNEMGDTFDYDFVKSLLDSGADVNTPDKNGQTILHEVARSWDTEIVTFLMKYGMNNSDVFKNCQSPYFSCLKAQPHDAVSEVKQAIPATALNKVDLF